MNSRQFGLKSLQVRILLIILAVSLLNASLTAFFFASRIKGQIAVTTRQKVLNSLQLEEEKVLSELARRTEVVNSLATQINLLGTGNPVVVKNLLADFLTTLHPTPGYTPNPVAAYVYFNSNHSLVFSGQSWTQNDLKTRPWWRRILAGQTATEAIGNQFESTKFMLSSGFVGAISYTSGPAVLPIYWVVTDGNGDLQYVVGIDFAADLTETATGPLFRPNDPYGELYDANGMLLALSYTSDQVKSKLFRNYSKSNPLVVKAIAAGSAVSDGYLEYKNFRNDQVLGVYYRGSFGYIYTQELPLTAIYGPFNRELVVIVGSSIIIAMIVALLLTWFLRCDVLRPFRQLSAAMDRLGVGDLETQISDSRKDEFGHLYTIFNSTVKKLQELIKEAYVARLARRQTELEFLQAQINPHFLYNTLDCIYRLVLSGDQKESSKAILNLSRLFRLSLGHGPSLIAISKAMEQLQHYFVLQQLRHGSRISVAIEVDSAILDYQIPKLLLQPVVENAFLHGLEPKQGSGLLVIKGAREAEEIHFVITDNGLGMTVEQLEAVQAALKNPELQKVHGLGNVHRRLILAYGETWGVTLSANPDGGLRVDIRWPALPV